MWVAFVAAKVCSWETASDCPKRPEGAALRGDPTLADCHYNLALLCEKVQKPREAIRHMSQYRRLNTSQSE